MVLITHDFNGKTYEQNHQITLTESDHLQSSKRTVKNGFWYFESTHVIGTGGNLIGFRTNNGQINFFPFFNLSAPVINVLGSLRTNTTDENQRIPLPFSIKEDDYTIGVGIDTKKHFFSVFYDKYVYTTYYNSSQQITSLNADLWGANDPRSNDTVTINFGKYDFSYNVSGLIPWEENFQFQICSKSISGNQRIIPLSMLMILI